MINQKLLQIAFVFFSLVACAQTSSADKEKIAEKVDMLYGAMVTKDRNTLQDLTAENLTYGHSSGTIENKEEYVEAVLTGSFDFISIKPLDQTFEISGDTAIVRHIFKAKGKNDGKDTDVRIGVMMVWQRKGGSWLLLARQAYKL